MYTPSVPARRARHALAPFSLTVAFVASAPSSASALASSHGPTPTRSSSSCHSPRRTRTNQSASAPCACRSRLRARPTPAYLELPAQPGHSLRASLSLLGARNEILALLGGVAQRVGRPAHLAALLGDDLIALLDLLGVATHVFCHGVDRLRERGGEARSTRAFHALARASAHVSADRAPALRETQPRRCEQMCTGRSARA